MNVINIVKLLYMSKLVLYFELLKSTKTVHVRNECRQFCRFFTKIVGLFFFIHKETIGKIENTRQIKYQLDTMCYRNSCQDDSNTTRKSIHRKNTKKMYGCQKNTFFLRSESTIYEICLIILCMII